MNKDKLIELAKQAGFVIDEDSRKHQPNCIVHTHYLIDAELMRFAELVAAAEREACAKVCEQPVDEIQVTDDCSELIYMYGKECADSIRARNSI